MENKEILNNCPHCGAQLSPWQKVLLNVDRAIVCKNCWYRIILEPGEKESKKTGKSDNKIKENRRGSNGNV